MFLKLPQISQENTYVESLFNKVAGLQHRCFTVKFAKFLKTPFLQNISCSCFWQVRVTISNSLFSEAATGGVVYKKVFLKISQNSQETTWEPGLRPATLLKKRLWHTCFPVNFAKFLRSPFLQNTSWRQLVFFLLLSGSVKCGNNTVLIRKKI